MSYRLLATDIDGTITDERGRLHLKAAEWIRKLEYRGIPVVLVSGRPLPFLESLSLYLGTSGPLIAENGAVIKTGEEITLFGDPQRAKSAMAIFQAEGLKLDPADDNRYRLVDVSIKKNSDPERVYSIISQKKLPVTYLETNVMFHLVDNKVSKGTTLLKILADLKIATAEAVVSGDSYNDLPLFAIGAFNLAVGNAETVLQSKADLLAKDLYGAGFAELIQEIFEKFNS